MASDALTSEHDLPRYPIREVSRRTGVATVTLRAWERRYGLVVPQRTDKGHRLYSEAQIEQLRTIADWVARGVPISQVRDLLRGTVQPEQIVPEDGSSGREQLLLALQHYDADRLDRVLNELRQQLPGDALVKRVLQPLWQQVCHQRYRSSIYQAVFRFARHALTAALSHQLRLHNRAVDLPLLGIATYGTRDHETSSLIEALAMEQWRPQCLGANLPLEALSELIQRRPLTAVLLHFDRALTGEENSAIVTLQQATDIPIIVINAMASPASADSEPTSRQLFSSLPDALSWLQNPTER